MTDEPRLPPQAWMQAASTRAVIAALEAVGGSGCARFVGGCVRDALLGRVGPDPDIDIATTLAPDTVGEALKRAGLRAVPTGNRPRHRDRRRRPPPIRDHHPASGRADRRPPRRGRLHRRLDPGRRASRLPPQRPLRRPGRPVARPHRGRRGRRPRGARRVRGRSRDPHWRGLPAHPALLPLPGRLRPRRAGWGGAGGLQAAARGAGAAVRRADRQGAAEAAPAAPTPAPASRPCPHPRCWRPCCPAPCRSGSTPCSPWSGPPAWRGMRSCGWPPCCRPTAPGWPPSRVGCACPTP